MVDEVFVRERITELRMKKGISEYKMSLDLGHSKSYIQSISSGRALPSLTEFLYICDYLGISPKDFFDEHKSYSPVFEEFRGKAEYLNEDTLQTLIPLIDRLKEKQ